MNSSDKYFDDLVMQVIEGTITDDDFVTFCGIIRDDPELRQYYTKLMRVHSYLHGRKSHAASTHVHKRQQPLPEAAKPPITAKKTTRTLIRLTTAALLLVMLSAGAWKATRWLDAYSIKLNQQRAAQMMTRNHSKPPLELLSCTGNTAPELPRQLPGYLSLYDGEAKIRLTSGVELTLIAPVSLEFNDSMLVRLSSGKMLAFVPPWARGFTVHTPQLEIWDLGTVFGVASKGDQDDVFVFQGSVQINESDGNAVDLCMAGEGVRAQRGELPRKIAAEWAEAEQLFASVAGRKALAEPEQAFKTVDALHEMWHAKYNPKPVEKKQVVQVETKPAKTISTGQVAQTKAVTDKAVIALSANKEESEMKTVTNLVAATVAAATIGVANIGLSVPTVSNVSLEQLANSKMVKVTYDLEGEAIVTLSIVTNGIPLPDENVVTLLGDVNKQVSSDGKKVIYWNAGKDWPENATDDAQAHVTAWSLNTPLQYCAVDLSTGFNSNSYPVHYFLSSNSVPFGVTNDLYKTDVLLLRYIEPTSPFGFNMGSPTDEPYREKDRESQTNVILSAGFYMGVYQVTQQQWAHITGNWPAYFTNITYRAGRPVERVSYDTIRGAKNLTPPVNWPDTLGYVGPDSVLSKLRQKTGLATFDLPTEAQWEYACRAGTTGAYNVLDKPLDQLARYGKTTGGRNDTTANGTQTVGSYLPNAWGLYDMHGNVYEWCLNWFDFPIDGGINPVGPSNGTKRVRRGGAYQAANYNLSLRSASRNNWASPNNTDENMGVRLVINHTTE